LAELIRKESNTGTAKIQVTLRNEGDDGFQREIYGDSITVERIITNRSGGGGYKLLDEHGKSKSTAKKDLDAMLDQLNIQVENPVAVLDQEDAKKFLTGKPEDKYNFFAKATDLERMDRTYANVVESISELTVNQQRVVQSLVGAVTNVRKLKKEVDQHGEIEKWEDKIGDFTRLQAWATFGYINADYQGSEHVSYIY
jgi:chromosome segregation ATPase